jgi:hypothetical protein
MNGGISRLRASIPLYFIVPSMKVPKYLLSVGIPGLTFEVKNIIHRYLPSKDSGRFSLVWILSASFR